MNLIKNLKKCESIPSRDGYGRGVVELGKENKNVVVLTADLCNSTRSNFFKEEFPERFFEIGISEQDMACVAAGMALSGKIPFISTYSVFCPGRNWDQIRVSVAYNKANVKLTGAHAGLSVGPDGATHQGLEDIAITRCLPNMTVLAPCDYEETKKATIAAGKMKGPVYLRFAREATPVFTTPETPFKIGQANLLRQGKNATIIACGPLVFEALLAAEKIDAEVINCHTIKPIDKETIIKSAKKTGKVITIEEHQVQGGMGSAAAEVLSQNYPVPMKIMGIQDRFGESGTPDELLDKFGLRAKDIIKEFKKF